MYLRRADIKIETRPDDRFAFAPAGVRHLAGRGAPFLLLDILLGNLAEGAVEDRHVMLEAEADIRVMIVGAVTGGGEVRGLQRKRLVKVAFRDLDAAIPVAMLDVSPSEDDQAGFEFFIVRDESHALLPVCRNCVGL